MKKLLSLVLALVLLTSCVSFAAAEEKVTLVVWSFTDELGNMIKDNFTPTHPNIEIEYQMYPTADFPGKLDPVLATNSADAPDVFALEAAFVKKYVDSDYTADLKDIGFTDDDFNKLVPAVVEIGTDARNSKVKALSWQATPGALFYRTSLADKYLGIKTPEEFQAAVADWDTFFETAIELNENSDGAVKMFSSLGDIFNPFFYARENGWVKDGKLIIDDVLIDYLDYALMAEEDGVYNLADQWSETWFAGMKSDITMCYFLPTWGLHYTIKPNCGNYDAEKDGKLEGAEGTYGDWTMVTGPSAYSWGGTWLGANAAKVATADDAKKAAMKELIHFITVNEEQLYSYAKASGDFVSNRSVCERIVQEGGTPNPFLGGQDHYKAFIDSASLINGSIVTAYDADINNMFNSHAAVPYSKGEKDMDTAIADFKNEVKAAFADLIVE